MRWFYVMAFILLWPIAHLLYPMRTCGRANIPDGPCIVCANHSNFIDPLLVIFAFGLKRFLRCMSKKENMEMPVLGWFYRMCGAYSVSRGESDISAVRTTMHILRDGGSVLIFPEGTRVDEDYAVPAKTGAVRMALKMDVPLLPVFITRRKRVFGACRVVIGQPYRVSGGHGDFAPLSDELLTKIVELGAK